MSLPELWKFLWDELTKNTVGWLIVFLIITGLVLGVAWLKSETDTAQKRVQEIKKEHKARENWCYEKGYFEVIHLEKLNKGYVCVDARDVTEIRTLVIPPEVLGQ